MSAREIPRVPENNVYSGREVNEILEKAAALLAQPLPANLSTVQAARALGFSPKQWRLWAEAGKIVGAWKASGDGPWRLPLVACEEHIRALKVSKATRSRTSFRGAYRKVQRPKAA